MQQCRAGRSAIPKATKPARIAENFDVDFELTSEQLAALDTGKRGGPETETETITLEGCGMPITEA
jgi:diketogulonate reductase-like aldo/keto reductase